MMSRNLQSHKKYHDKQQEVVRTQQAENRLKAAYTYNVMPWVSLLLWLAVGSVIYVWEGSRSLVNEKTYKIDEDLVDFHRVRPLFGAPILLLPVYFFSTKLANYWFRQTKKKIDIKTTGNVGLSKKLEQGVILKRISREAYAKFNLKSLGMWIPSIAAIRICHQVFSGLPLLKDGLFKLVETYNSQSRNFTPEQYTVLNDIHGTMLLNSISGIWGLIIVVEYIPYFFIHYVKSLLRQKADQLLENLLNSIDVSIEKDTIEIKFSRLDDNLFSLEVTDHWFATYFIEEFMAIFSVDVVARTADKLTFRISDNTLWLLWDKEIFKKKIREFSQRVNELHRRVTGAQKLQSTLDSITQAVSDVKWCLHTYYQRNELIVFLFNTDMDNRETIYRYLSESVPHQDQFPEREDGVMIIYPTNKLDFCTSFSGVKKMSATEKSGSFFSVSATPAEDRAIKDTGSSRERAKTMKTIVQPPLRSVDEPNLGLAWLVSGRRMVISTNFLRDKNNEVVPHSQVFPVMDSRVNRWRYFYVAPDLVSDYVENGKDEENRLIKLAFNSGIVPPEGHNGIVFCANQRPPVSCRMSSSLYKVKHTRINARLYGEAIAFEGEDGDREKLIQFNTFEKH